MIDLGTIEGLRLRDHELYAYCVRCDRWGALDLDALVQAGRGPRRLPLVVRCRICGSGGQLQVRPPVPARPVAHGWIRFAP